MYLYCILILFESTSLGLNVPCGFADPPEFTVFHGLSLAQGFLLPLYFALSTDVASLAIVISRSSWFSLSSLAGVNGEIARSLVADR